MFSQDVLDYFAKKISKSHQGKQRIALFKLSRDDPEQLARNIALHLMDWSTVACLDIGEAIIYNSAEEGAHEVVEYLKVFFADELGVVPA